MIKDDYLKECMSEIGTVPIDKFNWAYCRICANRNCARSGLNNSHFDIRVKNWEEILFNNVPRAGENDPNYNTIRLKNFSPVKPGNKTYEINSGQMIEESISAKTPEPEPEPEPEFKSEPELGNPIPIIEPKIVENPETPSPETSVIPSQSVPQPIMVNTPFVQGTVLENPDKKEEINQPGSTFTFNDDE
jgi:hypothetical protein